jgi:hypothetical protein
MMAGLERTARSALDELHADLPEGRRPPLEAARAALDRFHAAHAEAMTLSRRNSNVRSLLLSMGRKRALTVVCDEALAALADAIAKHQVTGTR